MIQDANALVLEILKQDNQLAMSVFEKKDLASTIRHYGKINLSSGEINRLCQEVTSILNKLSKKGAPEQDSIYGLKKTGQLLWDHLFTRLVKDKLKTAQILDLVLSLDEELINIPWEILYDGKDFLCLKFNLGRLVRTRERPSPTQYRSLAANLKMLILANPTSDLKSAYLEGIHIKNHFDQKRKKIRIDFKSTHIDTMYVKKNLRDYDIVHFAGHCEYDNDNPGNSGWVLSDGRFSIQDIFSLSESLAMPNLVFSNACYSARVATEAMDFDCQAKTYSLAAAFLFSGTRHYIGTIRKIEDPVSLAFAEEFYTQLINGKSIGECMRLARLRLIKEYGSDAVFWAGYLLYGDPNFVLFRPKSKLAVARPKRDISFYKKSLVRLFLAVSVVSICIYLYMWLPTLNPDAYLLFLKSQRLFREGRNQETISVSQDIIKKDPLFLSVYPLIADVYQRLGKREEALKYYFEYAICSERKQDKRNLASAYIGIGWVYQNQGQYPRAIDFYNKAVTLSRQTRDSLNEAVALRKLAVWHMDKGEYNKALELLIKSSQINRERQHMYEHRYNLACDYFDIGLAFVNKDDFTAAKEFYSKSRQLFEKLGLRSELSDYYFNLGEIYLFEKQYQKALDCYMKGLGIDQTQGNFANMASDYNMLGELYMEMDNLGEAEESFNYSVSICKQINAPLELAAAYYNLGLLYKQKGHKNKARQYLRYAQEIYSQIDTPDYQEVKEELLALTNITGP